MSYDFFKFIHIFGVIVFMGNIIVTALWKARADGTGNPVIVAFAQKLVILTDWVFTLGGVALVLIGGYGMASATGFESWETDWLVWGQGLFSASALIWIAILIPLQVMQNRAAQKFATGNQIPAAYWRRNRWWFSWGIVATIIPLATLYLMVVKP